MKFVIVSPHQEWGGAIALHRLCQCLDILGYDARVLYVERPFWEGQKKINFWIKWIFDTGSDVFFAVMYRILKNTQFSNCAIFTKYRYEPVKGCRKKFIPKIDKQTILVYPDTFYGNIFNGKCVVRWLLYHNRFPKEAYGDSDLFYCYREIFNDQFLNPQKRTLHIGYFDLDLYKRTNYGDRSGRCYIIRKGKERKDLPLKFDGPVIDDLAEEEKVRVLNSSEYCISYDTQTGYCAIAAMCGCISVMIPELGKTWDDYCGKGDTHYGVALGFDETEIEYAKRTADKVRAQFEKRNEEGIDEARKFAKECEEYFEL